MLVSLDTKFIGPAEEFHLEFGKRLTILTGDNGLGKSLLLDLAFFVCAEAWADEVVVPVDLKNYDFYSKIKDGVNGEKIRKYKFIPRECRWDFNKLISITEAYSLDCVSVYGKCDGGFSLSDPLRRDVEGMSAAMSPPRLYQFDKSEVWDGKKELNFIISEGFRRDWVTWKYQRNDLFEKFCEVLRHLSVPGEELQDGGDPIRLPGPDSRQWPVLDTGYGVVPVVHCSSAIKRILSLAYMIVWSWWEHKQFAKSIGSPIAGGIVIIIDEVENHLHPRWQRFILPALLSLSNVIEEFDIQFIVSTHSPLVMTSLEPIFDKEKDVWCDLDADLNNKTVKLKHRDFKKRGDADGWLKSEAFDLNSTRPVDYAKLLDDASKLMAQDDVSLEDVHEMNLKLREALPPTDSFLMRWWYIMEKKGWKK